MVAESRTYEEILSSKQPHPLHSEVDADLMRAEIQSLVHTYPRSPGQDEYLSLLSQLLIAWESETVSPPSVLGVEVLRSLLEDNGLTQSALVGPVFSSPGIVPEILSGKRRLTLGHIKKLAAYFHTSPAIFLG